VVCHKIVFLGVARSESSKGVESLQILHALRKASGRATQICMLHQSRQVFAADC
jgi:ABC-type hemin transport system ATPase subunit